MKQDSQRMTEGPIASQMLRFAAPLFLGNLFQQLYNTADALIVGRMLGNDALAAVSATGTLVYLIISLFVGISAGPGSWSPGTSAPRTRRICPKPSTPTSPSAWPPGF